MNLLHSLHNPKLKEQSMVYEIWEDGEITLTKGGELYGQRNLHCIVPGFPGVNVPLPEIHGNHSRMQISDSDVAIARRLICETAGVNDPYKDCLPGKKYSSQQELFDEINRRNKIALDQ